MWTDIVDVRDFYDSPVGLVARRMIRRHVREFWPDVSGMRVLGLGSATPYLRPLMEAAAEIENCENKTVYNTSLNIPEGYEKKHEDQQYETWFVAGCGEQRGMILRFYIDEQTGTLS